MKAHKTRNTLDLAKHVYTKAEQQCQTVKNSFQQAQRQINNLITLYLANHLVAQNKANDEDVETVKQQLQAELNEQNQVIGQTALQDNPLKTNLDILKAGIVIAMLRTATTQHQALQNILDHVGHDVARYAVKHQPSINKVKPRPLPTNFNRLLQKQVGHAMQKWNPQAAVNKNTLSSIRKIKQVAQRAVSSGERPINYKKDVQRILTGNAQSNGASGTAQNIIRTETCRAATQAKLKTYALQNVKVYQFFSLEARNTCADCRDLDGTSFKVSEAQEGVNCPPIHSSCRCWVEAVTDYDDTSLFGDDSGSSLDDLTDGSEDDEL